MAALEKLALLELAAGARNLDDVREFHRLIRMALMNAGIDDKSERHEFARKLLRDGVPRPVVRDRIMSRFDTSRATTYRIISECLKNREI